METIEKAYNDLVLRNHNWVNPVLRKFDSLMLCDTYFIVDLVDFEEIGSTPSLRIVYMRRRYKSLTDHVFSVYFQLI